MAQPGTRTAVAKTELIRFRLSARDLASIRKLARSAEVSVSEMIRTLIRRAKVAGTVQP